MDIANNLLKGFAYYSCDCKPARVSPQAINLDACLEIWQKTLEILGLSVDYLKQVTANTSDLRMIYWDL